MLKNMTANKEPKSGNTIRGDKIGKRANDWYVWVVCPECEVGRWILRWKLKLPNFTGLCQLCNALKHSPQIPHGDKHPRWNGGQTTSRGYVYIFNATHPACTSKGYVKRARLVLEEKLGRYLFLHHIPHHINGVKDNDRPNNLIELTKSQHTILHAFERRLVARAKSLGIREVVDAIRIYDKNYADNDWGDKKFRNSVLWWVNSQLKEWGIKDEGVPVK